MGGTFTDAGSWVEAGATDEEGTDARISARLMGFQRIAAKEMYDNNFKDYRIRTNGTYWDYSSIDDGKTYLVKLNVSAFGGGTVEYFSTWHGSSSFLTLAFYNKDFSGMPTSDLFISGVASSSAVNKYIQTSIPENAAVAVLCLKYDRLAEDSVMLRVADGKEAAFDEKAKLLMANMEKELAEATNSNAGFAVIRGTYEKGLYIGDDGEIINNPSYTEIRALCRIDIQETFRGGRLRYACFSTGSNDNYRLVFYNLSGEALSMIHAQNDKNAVYEEVDIPMDATSFVCVVSKTTDENWDDLHESYPYYLFAPIDDIPNVYNNAYKIERGHKDYAEPLGVNDNLMLDAGIKSYNGSVSIDNCYIRDADGILYGINLSRSLKLNNTITTEKYCCLKIKKNDNMDRVINVRESSGGEVMIMQDAQVGECIRAATGVAMARVLRNEKDYIWIYTTTKVSSQSLVIISYHDKNKTSYDEMELDNDRSFIMTGKYTLDDYINISFDKKYYRRHEKLGSKIAGKTAIVFGDSLTYFTQALLYDWGLNIYTISYGGGRMSYKTGKEDTWICNDGFIQSFKELGVEKADFIIFAAGANDPEMEDCDGETVKFVLENKRWFDSDADTDPFDVLDEEGKNRFTSSACMYAAAYSLCLLYKGACVAVVPPYRTPGVYTDEWNIEKYASTLFNGRFINCWNTLRAISEKLGAVFIENWTRDSVASANAYHESDGVHPPYAIAQDMASNIGHALLRYYDPIAETVIG